MAAPGTSQHFLPREYLVTFLPPKEAKLFGYDNQVLARRRLAPRVICQESGFYDLPLGPAGTLSSIFDEIQTPRELLFLRSRTALLALLTTSGPHQSRQLEVPSSLIRQMSASLVALTLRTNAGRQLALPLLPDFRALRDAKLLHGVFGGRLSVAGISPEVVALWHAMPMRMDDATWSDANLLKFVHGFMLTNMDMIRGMANSLDTQRWTILRAGTRPFLCSDHPVVTCFEDGARSLWGARNSILSWPISPQFCLVVRFAEGSTSGCGPVYLRHSFNELTLALNVLRARAGTRYFFGSCSDSLDDTCAHLAERRAVRLALLLEQVVA